MSRIYEDVPHVVLGAGGHARSMLALLAACGKSPAGCIAPAAPASNWPIDCPWLGSDEALDSLDPSKVVLVNGVGSVGDTSRRRIIFDSACARGFDFPLLVHPSAIIAQGVTLGNGAQVLAGVILQSGVTVAKNVLLNTGCIVDHDCVIDCHAHLAPRVTLSGGVKVGAGAHLGTAATVIQGITIGAGAIVGAGALVTRDVPPGTRVVGVPAK